jgi:hypothetical protein
MLSYVSVWSQPNTYNHSSITSYSDHKLRSKLCQGIVCMLSYVSVHAQRRITPTITTALLKIKLNGARSKVCMLKSSTALKSSKVKGACMLSYVQCGHNLQSLKHDYKECLGVLNARSAALTPSSKMPAVPVLQRTEVSLCSF